MTAQSDPGRPTTGVFLVGDEEDVTVERRDAGTRHDRTVVTARRTVKRYALYTNTISDINIAGAEQYASAYGHDNMRVEVFDGNNGSNRP